MPTISQAITEGASRLHAAGIDHTRLLTRSEEQIDEAQYLDYLELVVRRAAGEPLQYITGHQEFYGLDFIVTPDVLIPRPETEHLVEAALEKARELLRGQRGLRVVDVGTGSGCIALSFAHEMLKLMTVDSLDLRASDISETALAVA